MALVPYLDEFDLDPDDRALPKRPINLFRATSTPGKRWPLDHGGLFDLVLVISFYNGAVRILGGLQIDVEDEYQRYLDRFPLPDHRPR